jgi:hypothetical protein
MQSRQGNVLQALRTVENFLTTNAAKLDDVVTTGTRKKLAETITTLEATVNEQAGSGVIAKGGTSRYHALRIALIRDHMAPIARIARAELPPTPELSALRMPRTAWKMERLAAAAHGMAQAAESSAAHFVAAGLPTDFIARLQGAADAMVRSVSDRKQTRGRLTGATKGLATTISSALKLVGVIDALVTSALVDDPALLANWKVVKRVRRMPTHAPAETTPPAPVVLPSNATVPSASLPATRTASQTAA